MANQRNLKAFVRYDGSGRVVAGSLVLRKKKPKVGRWEEILTYECCNDVPSTTTTSTSNTTTTTTTLSPTAYSYTLDNPVGSALYNVDGSEAGKYWTVGSNYSPYTHIPSGQSLGVGTVIYMDQQCTQQWAFPVKYLITNIVDQYNINPNTIIWKVENGVVTENTGQFVNKAYYLLGSTSVRNELVPCNEFYMNGVMLDNGYTNLMVGINVYTSNVDVSQPIPLSWNYVTDNTNVYSVSGGVMISVQSCSGITTTTTTTMG
jgi:hypothetical protein